MIIEYDAYHSTDDITIWQCVTVHSKHKAITYSIRLTKERYMAYIEPKIYSISDPFYANYRIYVPFLFYTWSTDQADLVW